MKGRVWFFPHSNIESGVFALRPILEWRVLAGLGFTRWENWSKKFDNICGPWKQNNFRPAAAAEFRFPGVKPKLRGLPTSCLCRRHTREGGAGGEKTLSFSGSTNIDGPCAGNSALFSCVFQNWGFFGSAMSCSGFLNATTSGR